MEQWIGLHDITSARDVDGQKGRGPAGPSRTPTRAGRPRVLG